MVRYELYLLLHIAGAVVWLGGGLLLTLQAMRAERAASPERMRDLFADVDALGNRVFVPASLLVLVFGVLMVVDGPWGFGELWIALALGGFAATFLNGVLFMEPASGALKRRIDADGGMSPDALTAARRVLIISRADLVILFAILSVMVIKPTGGDVGVLAALALAAVAAIAYAAWRLQDLEAPVAAAVTPSPPLEGQRRPTA